MAKKIEQKNNGTWRIWLGLGVVFVVGLLVGHTINDIKNKPTQTAEKSVAVSPQTCAAIEELLLARLAPVDENSLWVNDHTYLANEYANLANRGCPENAEKYKALAMHEIEIARALGDDALDENNAIEVVDTYKKLDMEAEARQFVDTMKRITTPAIEFIQAVEKIINEE